MDDVISFPVWETADQWAKGDRGLMGTGSHVVWDGKPLTSGKKDRGLKVGENRWPVGKKDRGLKVGENRWPVEKMDRGLKVGENRGENAGSKVQSPIGWRGGGPLKTTRIKKKFLLICFFYK